LVDLACELVEKLHERARRMMSSVAAPCRSRRVCAEPIDQADAAVAILNQHATQARQRH
jgi:hypothetical protein